MSLRSIRETLLNEEATPIILTFHFPSIWPEEHIACVTPEFVTWLSTQIPDDLTFKSMEYSTPAVSML